MKTRSLSLLLLFAAAFITLHMALAEDEAPPADDTAATNASLHADGVPPGEFHQPQTDAENALNTLLLSDNNEEGGLLHKPAGDEPSEVASPFTQRFLDGLKGKGKRLKKNPGGKDKYYALVSSVLSCGEGYGTDYGQIFHTIQENDQDAVIMSVRRERINTDKPVKGPTYTLIKDGDDWKLDTIVCQDANFNTAR